MFGRLPAPSDRCSAPSRKMTDEVVTLGKARHVDVTGDRKTEPAR
jgi:hypothetical protein